MKRILLLVFTMFFVSVGTWATITISSETVYIGGGQYTGGTGYSGYGIYGATAGEIAKLLNGDNSVTVQWNGVTLDQLKSAEYIKVGSTSNPNVLNDADLDALQKLSGAKYLDIDGSTLADGANIASIKAGSAIEAVTLPNGLPKEKVNAAGAALTACNSQFGACLSLVAQMEEQEITQYWYDDPCSGNTRLEYTGTVNGNTVHIENITRPLTSTGSYATYVNTKFRNEETRVDPSLVQNGKIVPNPLKVELTVKYLYSYNGTTYNPANEWWLNDDGTVNSQYGGPGLDPGTQLTPVTTYTYTWRNWEDEDVKDYNGTPLGDETNGYYAMIENVYSDQYGYQFDVTSTTYNYEYIDENCSVATISYTDGPHETIDVPYGQDVTLTSSTKPINVPTGDCDVVAYVNTAGSLYKATSLDKNDVLAATGIVISGNINNGDISIHDGAGDPQATQNDADKFESNGAKPAFYIESTAASIKSVDISDASIDDYKHLRVLNAYASNLESVVFPKTLTKIPNYCCYSLGNNGCQNLSNVVFPTEATTLTIGDYAFHHTAIKNLVLPSSVTRVGDYAFGTCPNLYSVEMEGLKNDCSFGNYVFNMCKALQHVSLSEGVQNIGEYMFNQCVILESIRIPSTCKTIGSYAFQFCYDIHQITIPEGVELIQFNAFEGAGLTDIYIMATSIEKIPKIYAMKAEGGQNAGPSTFSYQRTTGNNTIPDNHRNKLPNADYDEVMTWYQEEQSGPQGLGSGNCLTALHYPESMKPFYEAIDVTQFYSEEELAKIPFFQNPNAQQTVKKYYTPTEYLAMSADPTTLTAVVNNVWQDGYPPQNGETYPAVPANFGTDDEGNPILYQYLPQSYAVDPRQDGSTTKLFGPDKDGRYYPSQTSYQLRMAAGATGTQAGGVAGEEVASAWGWRQFPLSSSIESIGEIPFEKEYDDTWYTMAFPWRMIDNQLFAAFNQKMEIVEFVGAEVLDVDDPSTETKEYNLVFHFEDVADTYYMDQEDNFYKRELETIREITSGEVTINKKFYKYTLLEGKDGNETSTVITDPYPYDPKTASDNERERHVKYLSIENIMVLAGHPYMIHPSIGASPGNPVKVYINGVKKIEPGKGLYTGYSSFAAVAEANKVTKTVSSRTRIKTIDQNGIVEYTYDGPEAWTNDDGASGGHYYFIGNINDEKKTVDETTNVETSDNGAQDTPLPCYILALPPGEQYPKYYRKSSGGKGKWSQYSAIIVPDGTANANVESLYLNKVTSPTGTGLAKGANVEIGEWDFNETVIIEENKISTIIDEALEKDPSTPIIRMNVVYNIKGEMVRSDSSSIEGLPKGIYIVNGKKYLVK